MLAEIAKFRGHLLYNLTRSRLTILLYASTVIHTTVVKSMTESKESELVMGGMNDTNSREESNGVFLNSKSVTRKLPENRANQIVPKFVQTVDTTENAREQNRFVHPRRGGPSPPMALSQHILR